MTCVEVQQDLKAELDGELGRWRAFLVRRHLVGCEACRTERAELARISVAFRQAEAAELPDALRARLIALAPEPQPTRSHRNSFALAGGALATACFAVLAFVLVRPTPSPDASKTTVSPAGAAESSHSERKTVARSQAMANAVPAESTAKAAPATAIAPAVRGRAEFANSDLGTNEIVEVKAGSRDELLRAAREVSARVVRREPLELEGSPRTLDSLQKRLSAGNRRATSVTARFRVFPPQAVPDR